MFKLGFLLASIIGADNIATNFGLLKIVSTGLQQCYEFVDELDGLFSTFICCGGLFTTFICRGVGRREDFASIVTAAWVNDA